MNEHILSKWEIKLSSFGNKNRLKQEIKKLIVKLDNQSRRSLQAAIVEDAKVNKQVKRHAV